MYLFFRSFLLNKIVAKRLELMYKVVSRGITVEFRKFTLIFNMQ